MRKVGNFDGKRILFISVSTFNYEREIALQLERQGAIVDFYDERPSNSTFVKGIIRIKRDFYQIQINKYYNQILERIKFVKYDYLFVIKGEVVPVFFLEKFKSINPNCKSIFYTWDAFGNNKHAISILKYFDDCFTFDRQDAKKYSIKFRPLFYIDSYGALLNEDSENKKYDLLFIGTAHSDRYLVVESIVKWCEMYDLKKFAYYFMQSRLAFVFKKFFDPSFRKIDYNKLSFNSLTKENITDLYRCSSVILDINHPNQSGLTMRTFEALGAGKKLITTNPDIVNYTFFNQENICIIDRNNPILIKDFFCTPFKSIDNNLRYAMSLEGWINDLFFEDRTIFLH
jgi:hypothetical protein